ncbi:MAG: hypothetical protein GC160_25640 [Acidobacteria bacterium]|nr:hypothetical protein [Acidobacteriota bacterium]
MRLHGFQKLLLAVLAASPLLSGAPKFYPDDPLWKLPEPLPVTEAVKRDLSDFYDYFLYTFANPAEQNKDAPGGFIPAEGVNTLGEVPDSEWFTNRIGSREMSIEELVRGPGDDRPPAEGPWTIVSAKTEGLTPGFMIKDRTGERYLLKFDPKKNPEMASAADFLGSRFFHALGYNTPQNYIVDFQSDRLEIGEGVTMLDAGGRHRQMVRYDVVKVLEKVPQGADGSIRALASRLLPGKPVGGFRYHGTRSDDPNDLVPHERRRDLRGLYVFCSWLGHDDSRSINTLDMLVDESGKQFIRHHLIDFGSILGSASEEANSPRGGNQYLYAIDDALVQIVSLGLYTPKWYRWDYKNYPSIGRFEHAFYQPDRWTPEYKNPAFANRLPDDTFWAAKKVMAFSDEAIRALVAAARYSNPDAAEWLIRCLIERRDKVGREYFGRVLPLDGFEVSDGRLRWTHLGEKYGFSKASAIRASWSRFDNQAGTHQPLEGSGPELPAAVRDSRRGDYFAAKLVGDDAARAVTVYLRNQGGSFEVVGIERGW